MTDELWTYMSGVVDGDQKLRESILKNPKAAWSLIGKAQKFNPIFKGINIPQMKEAVAYICGYIGVLWKDIDEFF